MQILDPTIDLLNQNLQKWGLVLCFNKPLGDFYVAEVWEPQYKEMLWFSLCTGRLSGAQRWSQIIQVTHK